jgi:tetratricopeptide (TPR) repeat protein
VIGTGGSGTARGRRLRAAGTAALVLALAVVLWLPLLRGGEASPFGLVPVLDEVWYLDRAAELDGLAAPADQPHFMSPLYPILIRMAGAAEPVPADRVVPPAVLRGLRLLQIACWLGMAVLLRLIAGRLLPADAPRRPLLVWLAPALFVLYRPAAVYAMAVLVELPLVFFVTLGLWLTLCAPERARPLLWAAAAGAAFGLAGLLRGTALVLVPIAAWWTWRRHRAAALSVAAVALVVLLPAVVHNTAASGRLAGPTLNAGVNLVIGNGPAANGFYVAVIDGDWRGDPAGMRQLSARLDRPVTSLAEADRLWLDEAVRTMGADPVRAAGLWLKKLWLHLQAWEIDQLTPLAGWTDAVPALRLLAAPWALLVVLALAGAVDLLARRRGGGWTLLLAGGAALLAVQSLFFVVSRYRMVLVPVAVLLAAAGAAALAARRRAAMLALVPALVLVAPWGLDDVRDMWRAMGLANRALRHADLAEAGRGADHDRLAEDLYRRALAAGAPGEASWLGLARVLDRTGRPAAADSVLAEGIAACEPAPALHMQAAARLLARGRPAAAEPHLRATLAARPHDADALHNLVIVRSRAGAGDEAEALARRLCRVHPDDPRGWNDLAILLARSGRRDEARVVINEGLDHVPGDADLQENAARLGGPDG